MTSQGEKYISTPDIGLSEIVSGVWIRKRISYGCYPVKIINCDRLNNEQLKAAKLLLSEPVTALYGFPGTGKTFVLKTVFDSLQQAGKSVAICSFTGSAASRLGEVLGSKGTTIHRLLGYDGEKFEYNRNNKLDKDTVIIDEVSQLPSVLHCNLLSALKDDCTVIYTGDPEQLGSIEPGNTLADLVSCIPSARLIEVQRTNPNGPIGMAARDMLAGEIPKTAEDKGDGFYLKPVSDSKIIEIGFRAQKRMAELHGIPFERTRALCPTNRLVQTYNDYCLKNHDGVIPIISRRNHYDRHDPSEDYFNGDTGVLDGDYVKFDNGAYHRFVNKLGIHEVGFGSTVFVAQGKEWIASLLLLPALGGGRPSFAEVYTAITRAKNRFIVIGSMNRFVSAIKSRNSNKRTTLLPMFVTGRAEVLTAAARSL